MCIICVDLEKGKLTPWEASRNRTEMIDQFDEEHLEVLDRKIREALLQYLGDLRVDLKDDQDKYS
tara:strand:+ start:2491 stop:2685 length:195 start_codon:yes stop_codon:yes gene_type:complete